MSSGVYKILNKNNGNFYIGSSYNIQGRIVDHKRLLRSNKHHNPYLQHSYNKHGENSFEYTTIEECDRLETRNLEQKYLDILNPKYNIALNSSAPMEGRKHSETTKALFKLKAKYRVKRGREHYAFGGTWTKDQRDKIIKKRIGSKRSGVTKTKMSLTAKRINSISRIDREKCKKCVVDSNGVEYLSLIDAARKLKASVQAVCDNLKGRSVCLRSGIQLKYKDEKKEFLSKETISRKGKGSNCKLSKLKKEDIISIRNHRINKLTISAIAKLYNVNKSTISKILRGETWKNF